MGLLAAGPRFAFGRTWDYHVLLFGAAGVMLGYNLILFDVLAKIYFIGAGFAQSADWLTRFRRLFTFERGLLAGAVVFLIGLGIEIVVVAEWLASGGGSLMAVRSITIGIVAMVVGAQTAFASLMISLMQIKHR
jgi:hypothetical protein